jgi:hypothetical protein
MEYALVHGNLGTTFVFNEPDIFQACAGGEKAI